MEKLKNIEPILNDITIKLKKKFKEDLISIILSGSYGRQKATEDSDIDLMVIANNLPSNPINRDDMVSDIRLDTLIRFRISVDFLLFTPRDVEDNLGHYSPVFSTLILGLDLIYDKDDFFKKKYINLLKKLEKTNIKYGESGRIWNIGQIAKDIVSSQLLFTKQRSMT